MHNIKCLLQFFFCSLLITKKRSCIRLSCYSFVIFSFYKNSPNSYNCLSSFWRYQYFFQSIVSKLEIPVSWQHKCVHCLETISYLICLLLHRKLIGKYYDIQVIVSVIAKAKIPKVHVLSSIVIICHILLFDIILNLTSQDFRQSHMKMFCWCFVYKLNEQSGILSAH